MKVYILTEKDIELLRTRIDRDPKHGTRGGSSQTLEAAEASAHDAAHRFYNYQVCAWIDEVTK